MCRNTNTSSYSSSASSSSNADTIKQENSANNGTIKFNWQAYIKEAKKQASIALPTTTGLLLYKIPWIISLHFVGAIGSEELAAAALATTLCNVTGLSFSVGLSFAITTLVGQARGDLLRQGQAMEQNQNQEQLKQKQIEQSKTDPETMEEEISYESSMSVPKQDDMGISYGTMTISKTVDDVNENEEAINDESMPLLTSKTETETVPISYGIDIDIDDMMSQDEDTLMPINIDNQNILLQPLVILYRGLAIQLAFVLPIGLWWIHGIEPVLVYLGQADKLSIMTESYIRILTPGLWAYSINWTVTSFLQSIEMADVPAWAAFVGFLSHVPFNILFVDILGLGYHGVALATVMFQLLQPVIILFYLFGTNKGRERILEGIGARSIGRESLSFWPELYAAIGSIVGIKQYLALALPGIVMISEWWASETAIFLAGTLHPDPDFSLDAMTIYQSINTFFFMFPMGYSVSCSTRVSMYLGMNDPRNAQIASRVGTILSGFISAVGSCFLFFTPHTFLPSLFTSDEDVVSLASQLIPLLAMYTFADGIQNALNSIMKGCGRQKLVMPVVVFAYWAIGLPIAYYNSFVRYEGTTECESGIHPCGVVGLVIGMTSGTWVHFLLLALLVRFAINWDHEAEAAQLRVSAEKRKV
eukprot:CAMPEP_0194127374 /NCGR_PEP_ID=MMETSP0150-20130528/60486_1 /TAXON_ID=122233 /ORGANISM="Chaetoceros debilis, Strain MM31A-1" /LENGTH=645 /DNA_ID=CAMNT_0038821295 /DNA_START=148 /DNA_END=2085 /DNA_ORIENTATION=+